MNKPVSSLSDELLARYLASTATLPEIERVEAWLDQSPDHIQELKAYRKLWERSRAAGQRPAAVDTDAAWRTMQYRMQASKSQVPPFVSIQPKTPVSETKVKHLPVRRTPMVSYWAAAIAALALVAFGWVYVSQSPESPFVSVSTQANTYEKTLPDGTKVVLNYNSTLSYQAGLPGSVRAVTLNGEAFFDVAPDPTHPFVIDANGTEIKVLGTSFNVKAYDEVVRVEVKTGKVEVGKTEKKVRLLPGEGVEVRADTNFKRIQATPNIASYSTQVFEFTETQLSEVVESLSAGYHVSIRLSNETLSRCRLTARYEKEPLDATLSLVAETMNLNIKREGATYVLEGNGCQ